MSCYGYLAWLIASSNQIDKIFLNKITIFKLLMKIKIGVSSCYIIRFSDFQTFDSFYEIFMKFAIIFDYLTFQWLKSLT